MKLLSLTARQVQARRFYFAEYVADYFRAFGCYPAWRDFRPLFIYASRKAYAY